MTSQSNSSASFTARHAKLLKWLTHAANAVIVAGIFCGSSRAKGDARR